MKKILFLTSALLLSATPAMAQNDNYTATPSQQDYAPQQSLQDPVMAEIKNLQTEWARIKYQTPDKDTQLNALRNLEAYAAKVTAAYPGRPEPKIWEGIILSTDAGIVKGLSALGKVKKARNLLEMSLQQNPRALEGSAHTSLGSLYYQVPGWPVGFGDDEKAEKHLKAALQINPDGIDPNFFYGDFLLQAGRMDEAQTHLKRALMAPERPDRPLADAGRRQEIKAKLAEITQRKDTQATSSYN